MISLFVVDDEKYIRESLCNSINWSQYDVKVVGSAENGEEAYDYLSVNEVDIVITDIRLPDIDGIELIRRLFKKSGNTGFIILSGYGEFEYAQKAIQYGVSAYLLKPCGKDEIINTVMTLKSKLRHETDYSERIESLFLERFDKLPPPLRSAIQYIENHYMMDITRDMVANHVLITSTYLSTLFTKYCKMGFNEYLNWVRIEHACNLLTYEPSLKIFEVAERVGFRDESYFSTVFRKKFGVPPSDYKRSSDINGR